ncbi:MAG: hypothetical protein WDZ30_00235 [Cellvibrionaceae bacterium]
MAKLTFRVIGLRSSYCAETLQIALNGIPGVKAHVRYKDAVAEVEVPPSVSVTTVAKGARQNGYDLQLMSG